MLVGLCALSACSNEDGVENIPAKEKFTESELLEAKEIAVPVSELKNLSEEIKAKRAASAKLSEYIELRDSVYYLQISEDEASLIGVPAHLYHEISSEIEEANNAVTEARNRGEIVVLTDIQEAAKAYKDGKIDIDSNGNISRATTFPSGRIVTDGMEYGYDGFETALSYKSVLFKCNGNTAATPVFHCSTSTMGEERFGTAVGAMFTGASITVPLALVGKNVYAKVGFRTTDSNGGFALSACKRVMFAVFGNI